MKGTFSAHNSFDSARCKERVPLVSHISIYGYINSLCLRAITLAVKPVILVLLIYNTSDILESVRLSTLPSLLPRYLPEFTMFLLFRRFLCHDALACPTCLLASVLVFAAIVPIVSNYIVTVSTQVVPHLIQSFGSAAFATPSFAPVTYICNTKRPRLWFCPKADPLATVTVTKAARTAAAGATLASNILESFVGLGNPFKLSLHPTEIRELAYAIQNSTALDVREVLASQLWELGELTTEVKRHVISLNSQGINVFSFAAYEVSFTQLHRFSPFKHINADLMMCM